MAQGLVGWKLLDKDNNVVDQWGGVWGQYPGIPNPLPLPSGLAQVAAAEVNQAYTDFDGAVYRLVEWLMDEPPAALPDLEPYQFFSMLDLSGKRAALDSFINALPSPANVIARNKLEHTKVFHRNNDLVLAAQQALGLTDQELDALWLQASAIQ